MERNLQALIVDRIENDEHIKEVTKIGLCRVWSKVAKDYITSNYPEIIVEAREVDLEPYLQHTFLRLIIKNEEPFLIDGIGSVKFPPFSGFESEAPEHLRNSRMDIINNL